MNIRPLGDRILVKRIQEEAKALVSAALKGS